MIIVVHHKNNFVLCTLHAEIALGTNGLLADKRNVRDSPLAELILKTDDFIAGALIGIAIIHNDPLNLVLGLVLTEEI